MNGSKEALHDPRHSTIGAVLEATRGRAGGSNLILTVCGLQDQIVALRSFGTGRTRSAAARFCVAPHALRELRIDM